MTTLLFIVAWLLIGAMLMAFLCGRFGLDPEGAWAVILVGTVAWPTVLIGLLVFLPARWVYQRSKPKVTK